MDRETFLTEIEDRSMELWATADVVRFDFVAQPSVSYLDLQLCKNSPSTNYFVSLSDSCARERLLRSYVNTQEKCRKFFTPSRELLYTLHLDLAREREHSLNVPKFKTHWLFHVIRNHIAEVKFRRTSEILAEFIKDAFDRNVPKLKLLEMVTKTDVSSIRFLPFPVASGFLECFYPEIPNSQLFRDFIWNFDLFYWIEESNCPKQMEYLLYCMRRLGNYSIGNVGHLCLLVEEFDCIGPILKYAPGATLIKEDYEYYLPELEDRLSITWEDAKAWMEDIMARMGEERVTRILQISYVHMLSFMDGSLKALGLMWNSIPDPYVTVDELQKVFGEEWFEQEGDDVHDFYKRAVGESCENQEPRSLKHLCRIVIRSALSDSKLWIPEGIGQLPLPKSIQLYLNLDQSLSIPFRLQPEHTATCRE